MNQSSLPGTKYVIEIPEVMHYSNALILGRIKSTAIFTPLLSLLANNVFNAVTRLYS